MSHDAIVIGGGLAGCSTALQLARRNHDVVLVEKATYPRHKLCGEFLSPEAQASFRRLGVLESIDDAGATSIASARLTGPRGTVAEQSLPETALGLSRYRLDALLFRRACEEGVDGRQNTRATAITGSLNGGFTVQTNSGTLDGRLVVGAYGRRSGIDRKLNRPFFDNPSEYVAFKAHYAGPSDAVAETIEVHAAPGGYCGVGPVEEGRVTVCWIGTTTALKAARGSPNEMLHNTLCQNPILADRLAPLTRVSDRFEAVSRVPLTTKEQIVDDVCMVGDSAGMIAPLCGDGMAMALRTADLFAPLASDFLSGRRTAKAFREAYQQQWNHRFRRRLRLGRWMHAAAFQPMAATALLSVCRTVPPLTRWLIRATRGTGRGSG